jgi:hypothetical protein
VQAKPRLQGGAGVIESLGWCGKKVRNADGREGVIRSEDLVLSYCTLSIRVSDGSLDTVELNGCGKDSGSLGWEWYCADFDGGPQWLILGDHNQSHRDHRP